MNSAVAARSRDKPRALTPAYRLAVFSRILAASAGGYALATLFSIVLAHVLLMPKAQRVLTATLLSFAIYAVVILWVFAVKSATRAWLGLLAAMGVCGVLWWLLTR